MMFPLAKVQCPFMNIYENVVNQHNNAYFATQKSPCLLNKSITVKKKYQKWCFGIAVR